MLDFISFINKYFLGICVPVLLLLLGVFYCIRLRLFHFLHPVKTIKALFEREKGATVSPIKAVTLALAGTLGVGNMVGVASAIALGGFGAIFWMWISALVATVLKYAEIVLAMKHRSFDENGRPHGSAINYIKACFKNKRLGGALAAVFALFCVFNAISMGSVIQVNSAARAMNSSFNVPTAAVGGTFAVIAFLSLRRGSSGALGITNKLVPVMTFGFVALSLIAIFSNPDKAVEAVCLIFKSAFNFKSGVGGVLGFLLSPSLRYGTMRGILSNEAGCGSAPAAHAVSDCKIPAKQGVWGIFEVFVDTILLCTLTAIVIIIGYDGGIAQSGNYMLLTINAYRTVLGDYAGYFISSSVLLFGLATVICWGYYGVESVKYLSRSRTVAFLFSVIYSVFAALGAVATGEIIWELADLAIGVMSIINLTVLLLMSKEVKRSTDEYFGSR